MIFVMNTLKMVFVWIVLIVFLFIKNEVHKQNKKLSLPSDIIIYTPDDLLMN